MFAKGADAKKKFSSQPVTHRCIYGATTFGKTLVTKKMLREVYKNSPGAKFIIYTPHDLDGWPPGSKIFTSIPAFVKEIEKHISSRRGSAHVVVDEFQKIKNLYGDYQNYPNVLKEITSQSRHHNITAWLLAQRPTMIHPDIRDGAREKICFYLVGENDRKAVHNESSVKEWNGKPLWEAIGELPHKQAFVIRSSDKFLESRKINI